MSGLISFLLEERSRLSRLLAMLAEEVYLVSPETAKLLSLKGSILKETPDAKLFLSARADKDIATWT